MLSVRMLIRMPKPSAKITNAATSSTSVKPRWRIGRKLRGILVMMGFRCASAPGEFLARNLPGEPAHVDLPAALAHEHGDVSAGRCAIGEETNASGCRARLFDFCGDQLQAHVLGHLHDRLARRLIGVAFE